MNPSIENIRNRSSFSRLCEPAPSEQEFRDIFEACLNVPDHLHLRPWRFLSIRDEGLIQLGSLFAKAHQNQHPGASNDDLKAKASKAQRAPLIVVGICKNLEHDKVPKTEQEISAGCVLHNLGLCLYSLGYGSVWRTGEFASNPFIQQGLGLKENETIVGYLYVGSPYGKNKGPREWELDSCLSSWS